jgi:GNAT superfamily N-acetyltransferase
MADKTPLPWPRLRAYDARDRDACAHIFVAAQRMAFPWEPPGTVVEADFDRSIQGEELWVAEIARPAPKSGQTRWQVAGLVSVFIPNRFVHSLFVDPAFHGLGLGSALLDRALYATGGRASLKCDERNRKGCIFYERRGWRASEWGWDSAGAWIRFSR